MKKGVVKPDRMSYKGIVIDGLASPPDAGEREMQKTFPVYAWIDHSGPDDWSNIRKIGFASTKQEADQLVGGMTSFADGCWMEHKKRAA